MSRRSDRSPRTDQVHSRAEEANDAWGPGKHGGLLSKAKETLGLGHGHANVLVHPARERAEAADPAAADAVSGPLDPIYASSKEPLRPLHEALIVRLDEDLGPFEIAPKEAYGSLRRSKQFATVGPGSRGRLEVGINHRTADGSARFEPLGPGKMCSHRVFVTAPDDIDDELLAFVAASGRGSPPADRLMYRPVRTCPVADPFGTELMIVAALPVPPTGA